MNQYIILHTVIKTFLCQAPYLKIKDMFGNWCSEAAAFYPALHKPSLG